MVRLKAFKRGQVIVYQGEASARVHIIRKGAVRVSTVLSNGNEVNIAIFGPGDYFPVSVAFNQTVMSLFDYQALTDIELEITNSEDFIKLLKNDNKALGDAARRYVGALMHINAIVQVSASEKLAHTLRYLQGRFGVKTNNIFTKINIKLTQQDLASLANLSRETTSIELKKLKDSGVVVERAKYYSVNTKMLSKMVDQQVWGNLTLQS